jgi:hypothetical protein
MRLLGTFSDMLPADGMESNLPQHREADPHDRMLHARLQGNKLGVFDVFFDSEAGEEVEAGQAQSAENGILYYNVWTSFSPTDDRNKPAKAISQPIATDRASTGDPTSARSYTIDAHVRPPTQLDAQVQFQFVAKDGGSRFLVFELSRFLQVRRVEADGKPVEFIQNPAIEGTHLARSGNDLVGVLLPEAVHKGQKISLRFDYGGEVLAEAGKGLLYVGARGNWYPSFGLALASFDLTFHYPQGWTLVATGKSEPPGAESMNSAEAQPSNASGEVVTSHSCGRIQSRQVCSRYGTGWGCHRRGFCHQWRGAGFPQASAARANRSQGPARAGRPDGCSCNVRIARAKCGERCRQCGAGNHLLRRALRPISLPPTGGDSDARAREPGMARAGLSFFLRIFESGGTGKPAHESDGGFD